MKGSRKIRIGTSGWSYNHWRGPFYPKNLANKDWLSFYTGHFMSVEINNSFYHLPEISTFEHWREAVPEEFIFSVKGSRYITHMKKLKNPQDALSNFLERAKVLQHKLGPVLFQLPPRWKSNPRRLASFLELLPDELQYAFEFRDNSWFNAEIFSVLKKFNGAFCIYDLGGRQSPLQITADFIYIRLHGPGGPYQGRYDTNTLAGWSKAFFEWARQGKEIYCYFDNDEKGYAAQDAMTLQNMVSQAENQLKLREPSKPAPGL